MIRSTTESERWMIKPIQLKGLLAKIFQLLMASKEIDYKWKKKWEKEFGIQIKAQQ